MKRFTLIFIFLISIFGSWAQNSEQTCNLGFTFTIGKNNNWGENEPVITSIVVGSPADRAGLKINDIILEVNGKGTYLKPYSTIMSWFAENDTEMSISIRNFEKSFQTLIVPKDCRAKNAITEAQLSSVYAFYSLEDVQNRRFVMPVKTSSNPEAIFSNYQTFDFAPSDGQTQELDDRINAIFERALSQRGLKRDKEDPDFIIQTFYNYQNNPLFKGTAESISKYQSTWRFDMRNNRMVKLPIYSPTEAVKIDDIAFEVEFGYRFFDRKFFTEGEPSLMWESEIKERLKSNLGLEGYLEVNLPILLLQFPSSGNGNTGTFEVNHLKFNYTGIGYDMSDLKKIVSVDKDSPAYLAGIRPGDVIVKLQGLNFNFNSTAMTEGYRRFIAETMAFRDKETRYTDNNGFQECMFWDVAQYNNIANSIADKRYKAIFAYLFGFNQYIDWNTMSNVSFEVKRGKETLSFDVMPIVSKCTSISAL